MSQPNSCLPPNALELRGEERRGGKTHHPFLGGYVREGLLLRMPNTGQLYLLTWEKMLTMGAEVAGCSPEELAKFTQSEAHTSHTSHSGPGGPVHPGACHERRRTA